MMPTYNFQKKKIKRALQIMETLKFTLFERITHVFEGITKLEVKQRSFKKWGKLKEAFAGKVLKSDQFQHYLCTDKTTIVDSSI